MAINWSDPIGWRLEKLDVLWWKVSMAIYLGVSDEIWDSLEAEISKTEKEIRDLYAKGHSPKA